MITNHLAQPSGHSKIYALSHQIIPHSSASLLTRCSFEHTSVLYNFLSRQPWRTRKLRKSSHEQQSVDVNKEKNCKRLQLQKEQRKYVTLLSCSNNVMTDNIKIKLSNLEEAHQQLTSLLEKRDSKSQDEWKVC